MRMLRIAFIVTLLCLLAAAGCRKDSRQREGGAEPFAPAPAPSEPGETANGEPWPLEGLQIPPGATPVGGTSMPGRAYGSGATMWEARFKDDRGWDAVSAEVEQMLAGAGFNRVSSDATRIEPQIRDNDPQGFAKGLRTYVAGDRKTLVRLEYKFRRVGDDGGPEHLYRYELLQFAEPQDTAGMEIQKIG
jgi:hypothetical protein